MSPKTVNICVMADTHIKKLEDLPHELRTTLHEYDLVVHLGDYVSERLVDELTSLGNFRGVTGNHDPQSVRFDLPKNLILEVNGKKIGMTHGCLTPFKALHKLRARFGNEHLDAIFFGHWHLPVCKVWKDTLFFCPGSTGGLFPSPFRGYGIVTVGDTIQTRIVSLPKKQPARSLSHQLFYRPIEEVKKLPGLKPSLALIREISHSAPKPGLLERIISNTLGFRRQPDYFPLLS